jgi:hypothetical protein
MNCSEERSPHQAAVARPPKSPITSMRASNRAASARLTTGPREKYMWTVSGVECLAAQIRRIASPRTFGAPRGCDHSERVLPLVIHGEMTRCAPRQRQRTHCRRCVARNRLKGPSLIKRRRNSRGIAILVGGSRLGRRVAVAFWGSQSSAPSAPSAPSPQCSLFELHTLARLRHAR